MQSPHQEIGFAGIPLPIASFVAREAELATLKALLDRPDVRLVTLTGPGGVGKTRLALQTIAGPVDAHETPVSVISLAAIRDYTLVPGAIARTLGIREQPGLSTLDTLARGLGDQRRLILLDNLEQVVEIGPQLGVLLGRCAGLTLLITSRVRLNIMGEYQVPVQPLALPSASGPPSLHESGSSPAVALFVQRAEQAQPGFTLTDANHADVIEICRRLDGLPLAIELAAARLSMFTLDTLRAGLGDRFRLLRGGPRDQPARLQSLSDAIDWSYGLLEPPEQRMMRLLSVFLGGWTIAAAAAVADVTSAEAFDLIASLSEKNLLRAMAVPQGRDLRFTMLETIREFGLERLLVLQEMDAARTGHAAYFLELAEQASPLLDQAEQGVWLDILETEHDNIRLALDWYYASGDAGRGIRLAGAIFRFWDTRDHLTEGRRHLDELLALPQDATTLAPTARALEGLAELSLWQGDYEVSRVRYTDALELFRSLRDRSGEVRALKGLALSALSVRDLERGEHWVRAAEHTANALGDPVARADADHAAGALYRVRGQNKDAEAAIRRAFDVFESVGDRSEALGMTGELAEIAAQRGDIQTALIYWADVLDRTYEVGEAWCLAWYLEGMAHLLVLTGRLESATRLLGPAMAWHESHNSPPMLLGGTEMTPNQLARIGLGPDRYAHLIDESRTMPMDAAIELAKEFATVLTSSERPQSPAPHWLAPYALTAREGQIFTLLCDRLTDKEIGDVLSISPRTVSTHVTAILAKVGLSSRREVPALAARLNSATGPAQS